MIQTIMNKCDGGGSNQKYNPKIYISEKEIVEMITKTYPHYKK